MRAVLILLASTGCSQIFGLEAPQRFDAAVADTTQADAPRDAGMPMTVTFQNDVAGYTSARDTWLDANGPNVSRQNDSPLRIRNADRWALLAFADLTGPAATQIPPSATIVSARLDIVLAATNCQASLADVLVAWPEAVTYNTFGPTPGPQVTEDFATPFAPLPTATPGPVSIDVTNSVKAWQTAPQSNNGWVFVPTGGTTDCTIRSSKENQAQLRPLLSITYVP